MKIFFHLSLVLSVVLLFGCGGSDEGSGSEPDKELPSISTFTPETVPADRKAEFELYLKAQYWGYLPAITGLYKVELNGDISYYYLPTYVESNGYNDYYITAYNFLGDDFDKSSQCYLPAREGDLNYFLNTGTGGDSIGTALQYTNMFESKSGNPEFLIKTPAGDIVYEIDHETKKVVKTFLNEIHTTDGTLVDEQNKIALSFKREFDITFAWIQDALCKGLPASEAPAGFAGVYDTSTLVYEHRVENYLEIDEQGILHNWKYMGDGFSPTDTDNCYKKAQWYNRILNNEPLMYNKELNYLFATVNQVDYRFYLDSSGSVVAVGVPEPVETFTNPLIDVTISARKSAVTIEDMKSMECE
ncbi:hypothetical protein [Cellvibrio sp. QJXJ]|uniref:hypothetical protein n=1 Tax=Cellvibrio sp. QJXJ TaxID=2964606 RepID=UPI0021C3B512|nr:hypothetical protein [Cellvibrio sp. QJXJ]UUA75201.1 hypothetical protein NNX04_22345 [Cellvibrio sp. QJXJ]